MDVSKLFIFTNKKIVVTKRLVITFRLVISENKDNGRRKNSVFKAAMQYPSVCYRGCFVCLGRQMDHPGNDCYSGRAYTL